MDKYFRSLAFRLSRVSFRESARLLLLMVCAVIGGLPAVSQAIDDRTYEEIYVSGSISSSYYSNLLERDWELYASSTMDDPALLEEFSPSGTYALDSNESDEEKNCLAEADISFSNCEKEVLSWYIDDIAECDDNYSRRLEGWTIGIKSIFSFEFKSSCTICREDSTDLRDLNLATCERIHAQDTYACIVGPVRV